jgi:hypothetical protein
MKATQLNTIANGQAMIITTMYAVTHIVGVQVQAGNYEVLNSTTLIVNDYWNAMEIMEEIEALGKYDGKQEAVLVKLSKAVVL